MIINCKRDDLYSGLNTVLKAVPQKTPLSSLDCILIDATKEKITLYATDNEIGIETKIDGKIEQSGIVAINAKTLTDFIKSLSTSEDVIIESDSSLKTKISYSRGVLDNIVGKTGEEFNKIPDHEEKPNIVISQYSLKEMISKTIFSVSEKDNIMTGELFELKNEKFRIVSMDGHRISIRNTLINSAEEIENIIIPSKALSEINKILSGSMEDKVNIYLTQKYAIFNFDETVVYTALLKGEYFKIDRMLSKEYTTKLVVNRQNLMESVTRANLLVKESDRRPAIFKIDNSNLQISMNSQTSGKFDENIDIEKEGDDLIIGFNPKFIIEALRAIDDENVNLYFEGQISPLFIRDEEETYNYLILPINIANEII